MTVSIQVKRKPCTVLKKKKTCRGTAGRHRSAVAAIVLGIAFDVEVWLPTYWGTTSTPMSPRMQFTEKLTREKVGEVLRHLPFLRAVFLFKCWFSCYCVLSRHTVSCKPPTSRFGWHSPSPDDRRLQLCQAWTTAKEGRGEGHAGGSGGRLVFVAAFSTFHCGDGGG